MKYFLLFVGLFLSISKSYAIYDCRLEIVNTAPQQGYGSIIWSERVVIGNSQGKVGTLATVQEKMGKKRDHRIHFVGRIVGDSIYGDGTVIEPSLDVILKKDVHQFKDGVNVSTEMTHRIFGKGNFSETIPFINPEANYAVRIHCQVLPETIVFEQEWRREFELSLGNTPFNWERVYHKKGKIDRVWREFR